MMRRKEISKGINKILALFCCIGLLFSLAACQKQGNINGKNSSADKQWKEQEVIYDGMEMIISKLIRKDDEVNIYAKESGLESELKCLVSTNQGQSFQKKDVDYEENIHGFIRWMDMDSEGNIFAFVIDESDKKSIIICKVKKMSGWNVLD